MSQTSQHVGAPEAARGLGDIAVLVRGLVPSQQAGIYSFAVRVKYKRFQPISGRFAALSAFD